MEAGVDTVARGAIDGIFCVLISNLLNLALLFRHGCSVKLAINMFAVINICLMLFV